jgi:hypothetical protein
MIDLEKKYTNKCNDEIKLSHIDRGIVYGWVKLGIDWYSHQWDEETGKVLLNAPDVNNLVEVKPDEARLEDRVVEIEFLQWWHYRLGLITLDSEKPLVLKAKIKGDKND